MFLPPLPLSPPLPFSQEVLAQCLQMLSLSSTSSSLASPLLLDTLTPQRQDVSQGRFTFSQQDGARRPSFYSDPMTAEGSGALFTDAFALACQLLVEFCSFPRYQSSLPQVCLTSLLGFSFYCSLALFSYAAGGPVCYPSHSYSAMKSGTMTQ